MIPQILLSLILILLAGNSYREKNQSPAHLKTYQITLGFVLLLFALLYWGGFYDQLISRML